MSEFRNINGHDHRKTRGLIEARSKCCNAIVKVEYKKLIPNTTVISKDVDYFYCNLCKRKLNQQTMEPLE